MEINILLVEDSNIQREALQNKLKEVGWNVFHAKDVEEALFQVKKSNQREQAHRCRGYRSWNSAWIGRSN